MPRFSFSVISFVCYFGISTSKWFGNVFYFFPTVCKSNPFFLVLVCMLTFFFFFVRHLARVGNTHTHTHTHTHTQGGADKSFAWPGRKQATVTKLGIYSTYSPRSSIHFLAHCSNFFKPLKRNSDSCPSNHVSVAAMTSASDEKWQIFNCFFSPGDRW